MSHVITSKTSICDLNAFAVACERRGLELVRDQETYRWYGDTVGGEVPEGFTETDLGKCSHAVRIPGDHEDAYRQPYEIGVVQRRDGQPGYQLMYDFYQGGFGMQAKAGGEQCEGLIQEYVSVLGAQHLGPQWIEERKTLENGSVVFEFTC